MKAVMSHHTEYGFANNGHVYNSSLGRNLEADKDWMTLFDLPYARTILEYFDAD